jgi:phosphate binding protein
MNRVFHCCAVLPVVVLSLTSGCGREGADGLSQAGGRQGSSSYAGEEWLPEGAVAPTPETIESGAYTPLSRPLYLYVKTSSLKDKPAVAAFLNYYLSPEGQDLVEETGYIRLSPAQLEQTKQTLAEAGAATNLPADLTGEVVIDGSSTVAPISSAVSEEFSKLHRRVRVPVGTKGTGGGFKRFIEGDTDINDASRPIKESEAQELQAKGIEFVELKVAIDGLTVVVNPQNNWVDGLTVAQLEEIWKPSSTVQKWSDLNPDWPDEPIKLFGPDTDSGTFDYFTEVICGESGASRSDYQQNTDDNFLVTGVAGDEFALGYFGYAYYVENQDKLQALAIAPSAD